MPTTTPTKTRTAKKRLGRPPAVDNPQARIIDAAAELFAEKGYETSSLGDLAAAMGVSKAAIYHYFATKQGIYDAIIIKTLEGLVQAIEREVAGQTSTPAKLRSLMTAHARYFEEHRAGFVAMLVGFSGMTNTEFKDEAMRLRDTYEQLLRNIISEGVADGAFRSVDSVTTARAVLSLLNWMVRWFKPGAGMSAEQIALDYYELLVGGLLLNRQPDMNRNDHGS